MEEARASSSSFMRPPHEKRLDQLCQGMRGAGAHCFLTSHPANVFCLSRFSGASGALLVEKSRACLFTDSRFRVQGREEVRSARLEIVRSSPAVSAGIALSEKRGPLTCAFEDDHLTVAQWGTLRKAAGRSVRWKRLRGAVEALRVVKDAGEIQHMRDAATLASRVVKEVIRILRPGMLECEVAAEIDYRLRLGGASGTSFETIVA